jgi:thioredoxin 1
MVQVSGFCFLCSLLCAAVVFTCLVSTATATSAAVPSGSGSGSSCSPPKSKPIFGVAQRLPAIEVRGGAVLEPESAADVDAIVIRAGSEGKLVVIDFSATWCGPCRMIAPLFKELSESIEDVVFVKIDVDENPDTAAKYNVSAMPTFVFLKAGEVVDRLMGANPARLQELIDEHK